MNDMEQRARQLRDEAGATAVEYGLMIALIALAILAGVSAIAPALIPEFQNAANGLL